MSMTDEQKRGHAQRLIETHNERYEFCLVYEDEDLEDASEQDQRDILDLMYAAKLQVSWV